LSEAATPRVPAGALADFIARVCRAYGVPADQAGTVGRLMVESDLAGQDGHGIFRLPQYVERLKVGGINVAPNIKVNDTGASTALIDGDNAFGHLVVKAAADLAIAKAKATGIGWVGTRHSNHAGAASVYASMPLAHDMIGIYIPVGNTNFLPPWGGTEKLLSTNPVAVAVPSGDGPPVVLDMATTVTAFGKIRVAAQQGKEMPIGWMIDREGQPLTDPKRAGEGFLLPIGGYKGYGLSLILGLLAGTLNGAAFGKDVVDANSDSRTPTNTGQTMVAIKVAAFCDPAEFRERVEIVRRDFKASPRMPGVDEIFLPGEQSWAKRQERTANGVPVPAGLVAQLSKIAAERKVALPAELAR
jgi:LDH2 family malate/lactate/ureidoglycolate dehydrogenase